MPQVCGGTQGSPGPAAGRPAGLPAALRARQARAHSMLAPAYCCWRTCLSVPSSHHFWAPAVQNQCDWNKLQQDLPGCAWEPVRRIMAVREVPAQHLAPARLAAVQRLLMPSPAALAAEQATAAGFQEPAAPSACPADLEPCGVSPTYLPAYLPASEPPTAEALASSQRALVRIQHTPPPSSNAPCACKHA